jgi:crossover junction endodeoxyribonuclease RuvC
MGIDHGSKITGYGLLSLDSTNITNERGLKSSINEWSYVGHGFVKDSKISYPLNLVYMSRSVRDIIRHYEPKIIVFEGPKSNRGFKSSQALVETLGCLKKVAIELNRPYVEIEPTSLKLLIAGHGWATKEEVARAVSTKLNIPFEDLVPVEYYKSGKKVGQFKKYILDGTDALGLAMAFPDYYRKFGRLHFKGVGNDL